MPLPALLALAFLTLPLVAQVDRLELCLRLREVERSLADEADAAHRKAGFAHIEQAVAGFFAFDLAATARSLSEAELALRDIPAATDMLFANALSLRPTLPGTAILAEAEALAAAVASGKPSDQLARPGQHWIAVRSPTRSQVARLAIPNGAKADERLAVVVALHGAGGSENMFFDAYGHGALVQACVERGWFVIAPRCGLLGGVDLPALLAAMATRWPIDHQRLVLVGHSMGAMQAVAAAVAPGANDRAIAALGGGGRFPADARLSLPSFVGIGSRDFARGNALQLHAALQRAGSKDDLREYGGVEHLKILPIATPDVLDFFAAALAPIAR